MPLVEFVGGIARGDNTQEFHLAPADDGTPRVLVRGGKAVEVSGDELRALAGRCEIRVVEEPTPLAEPDPPSIFVTHGTSTTTESTYSTPSGESEEGV